MNTTVDLPPLPVGPEHSHRDRSRNRLPVDRHMGNLRRLVQGMVRGPHRST